MRFIVRLLAVVGLLFILLIVVGIFGISRLHVAGRTPVPVSENSVLTLTIEGPFTEESPVQPGLAAALSRHPDKLRDVIAAIDRAGKDARIKGLLLKIDASAGMAQTQELRGAIKRFRDTSKFVYAFADDYGGAGPGNGQYYLASAADQIWLQPMGEVMLTGVALEGTFFKDALAKIDVEPQFSKRAEYKTAPETFTERGFSQGAREMMDSLANDLTMQLVADIAAGRKLEPDQLRPMFDRGPQNAQEALEVKLVDHIGYADEAVKAARAAAGNGGRTVPLSDYERQTVVKSRPNIALIYEVGQIGRVGGPIDPAGHERSLENESAVMRGFAKAIASPDVKAIVFRVDSPGGSVSGSETLRRMVVRAKEAGKKVVVSMGATAASGGYWISANADKIVADPATLTGSIGVFSGKFVVGKALGDLGITTDRTSDSGFATMNSPFTAFTPEQMQRLNSSLDQIYDGFISRVAEGRKLPPGAVAQSAKGRVWTGKQAKQLGLVDELGGLTDAVKVAHDVAAIPADQPSVVAVFPEPLSPIETIRQLVGGNADMGGAAADIVDHLDGPAGALARALSPLFRVQETRMVRMPDLGPVQ